MFEFLHNYGLWIALGVLILLMHLFGMACCGGRHRHEDSGGQGASASDPKGGSSPK
jgi:hypothetical protein